MSDIRTLLAAAAIATASADCRAQPDIDPPTAAVITDSIARTGTQATIRTLWHDGRWEAVADRMGSGDAAWIGLAPKLAPGADGGPAEDLGISLAYSLPLNAPAVLTAIKAADSGLLSARRVCGLLFIEDSAKDRPGYKREAMRAVAAVADPSLADVKAACVAALERAAV